MEILQPTPWMTTNNWKLNFSQFWAGSIKYRHNFLIAKIIRSIYPGPGYLLNLDRDYCEAGRVKKRRRLTADWGRGRDDWADQVVESDTLVTTIMKWTKRELINLINFTFITSPPTAILTS